MNFTFVTLEEFLSHDGNLELGRSIYLKTQSAGVDDYNFVGSFVSITDGKYVLDTKFGILSFKPEEMIPFVKCPVIINYV